jgi:hypothetical protein
MPKVMAHSGDDPYRIPRHRLCFVLAFPELVAFTSLCIGPLRLVVAARGIHKASLYKASPHIQAHPMRHFVTATNSGKDGNGQAQTMAAWKP